MSVTRESGVVGFDADAAVEAARAVAGDQLRVAAEFDVEEYRLLYVSDDVLELFGSEEPLRETADRLHSYIHLDFVERELFEEITEAAGQLETYITRMEHRTFVRHLVGREGLFLSLETGTELEPLLQAIDDALSEGAPGE